MATEIERKFLLDNDDWRSQAGAGETITQAYLLADRDRSVRIRSRAGQGTITIKGRTEGASRPEFEYSMPGEDVQEIIEALSLGRIVDKTRYEVLVDGCCFEIDEFHGDNAGLVVAEIELTSEGQEFPRPGWLGAEITDDPRYLNSNLAQCPFNTWDDS